VQVGSSSWTQVALGDRTMYAIDTNGRLFSWGDSSGGFRGSGNLVNSSSPIQIGSSSWTMVNAYKSTVVALRV
jgi:alpha-tubulin suppressor-like RCC1 family protein